MRGTAFIVSRKGANENALTAARGALRESGKLIICLSLDDIFDMLEQLTSAPTMSRSTPTAGRMRSPARHYGDSLLDFSQRAATRRRCAKAATEAIVVGLEKHGLEPIDALGDMMGKSARFCKLSP